MHWPSIASLLLQDLDRPALLLDRRGQIRLVNAAFERLTGWPQRELAGQHFCEACHVVDAEKCRAELVAAVRGALHTSRLTVSNARGQRLLFTMELNLVGGGLLALVTSAKPVASAGDANTAQFEISTTPEEFGIIRHYHEEGVDAGELVGRRCHEVLCGRNTPCERCPVTLQTGATGDHPRFSVLRHPRSITTDVVTVQSLDAATVRVTLQRLTEQVVQAVLRARMDELTQKCGLSAREQQVFDLLVLGRTHREIGIVLEMSVRTVKFHQTRILEKFGADSRNDLIRLVI